MNSISELQRAKILIVDDQPLNIAVLEHLLACAGYGGVSSSTDAREVVRLHSRYQFDLILLNQNMPQMDGFEVLERLRLIDSDASPSVMMMAGDAGSKQRALDAGAGDFICRPYDYADLLLRIRTVLEARSLGRKEHESGLRQAQRDDLTGLPNRSMFVRSLPQLLTAAWPKVSALMLIDLDGFAGINHTLGQQACDDLLRQFAQRLKRLAPAHAVLGRFGDHEFAMLLPALDSLHQALLVADDIRLALDEPFLLSAGELNLAVSFGIAACPADTEDAALLVEYASAALLQAKREGDSACRFFTETMTVLARERCEMENVRRKGADIDRQLLDWQPEAQAGA